MSEKNAAIIIAVSDYQRANGLPACKNDGSLIRDILRETGRFEPENIYYEDTKTDSANIKGSLSKFIGELGKQQPAFDEVFFYYTGHGLFDGNDFFYILTDYEQSKLNQTCLSNSELDGMLRSLNPALAIKVIDACESGTSYIKTAEDIQKALNKSEQRFKRCYFLYSSEQTQTSGLDRDLSYFTRAFARSLLDYENRAIRYSDIIASIRDRFAGNTTQTPFFNTQAGHTEVFAEVTPSLVAMLQSRSVLLALSAGTATGTLGLTISGTEPTAPAPVVSVVDKLRKKIKEDELSHCTEEEANNMFGEVRKAIETEQHPELLLSFFDMDLTFFKDNYNVLPAQMQIGKWFDQHKTDYFVDLEYEQVPDNSFPYYPQLFGQKYRSVLKRFDTSVDQPPYRCVQIKAKPRHLNLPMWCCYIALFTSKTEMRAFYSFVKYVDRNWQQRRESGQVNWTTTGFPLKDTSQAKVFVNNVLGEFTKTIEKELMERHKL